MANCDKLDEGMYHYPQILDIAYAKPASDANSEVAPSTFPDIVDVKPSDVIADEFILKMAKDILDSTKIVKNEYPSVLDFSN
ncbi:hypothetical protein J6W32_01180 [bacterium]|nr:hypothetical protein [bacterium]MBP5783216.1 hypothetical protein [bacterium]